jgi:hypothetical protein
MANDTRTAKWAYKKSVSDRYHLYGPRVYLGFGLPDHRTGTLRHGWSTGLDYTSFDILQTQESNVLGPDLEWRIFDAFGGSSSQIKFDGTEGRIAWKDQTDYWGSFSHANTDDRTYSLPDKSGGIIIGNFTEDYITFGAADGTLTEDSNFRVHRPSGRIRWYDGTNYWGQFAHYNTAPRTWSMPNRTGWVALALNQSFQNKLMVCGNSAGVLTGDSQIGPWIDYGTHRVGIGISTPSYDFHVSGKHSYFHRDTEPAVTIRSDGVGLSGQRVLELTNQHTPASDQFGVQIRATAKDSADNTDTIGILKLYWTDPTSTSESGRFDVALMSDGDLNTVFYIDEHAHDMKISLGESGSVPVSRLYLNTTGLALGDDFITPAYRLDVQGDARIHNDDGQVLLVRRDAASTVPALVLTNQEDPVDLGFTGLQHTTSNTASWVLGTGFTTSENIRLTELIVDGKLIDQADNIGIFEEGNATPLHVFTMSGTTMGFEDVLEVDVSLDPGTYRIAGTFEEYYTTLISELTPAEQISDLRGVWAPGTTLVYPGTASDTTLWGHVNFRFVGAASYGIRIDYTLRNSASSLVDYVRESGDIASAIADHEFGRYRLQVSEDGTPQDVYRMEGGDYHQFYVSGTTVVTIKKSTFGLGTTTIPHASVGGGMMAVDGPDSSVLSGPHIQFTTASDNRPLLGLYPYTHDAVQIAFDCYLDTGPVWKASDNSSILIQKQSDQYWIYSTTGNSPGDTISWDADYKLSPKTYHRWGLSGVTLMTLTPDGLGIDTIAPYAKLDLGQDVDNQKLLMYATATARYGFGMDTGEMRMFCADNGHLAFGKISTGDGSTWTELAMLTAGGCFFINETANANQTRGITIMQNTGEVITLKSSGVAHGITDVTETDTYALMQCTAGNSGGIDLQGFNENSAAQAIRLMPFNAGQSGNMVAKSTAATGMLEIIASKKSGTGYGAPDADANLFVIRKNLFSQSTVFLVDEDGDTWQTGGPGYFSTTPMSSQAAYQSISDPPTQAEVEAIRDVLISAGLMASS